MNLREAYNEVLASARAGNAVLVESPSGLGKSQMGLRVYKQTIADNPGKTVGLGIIFAATQTPPDLIGFQFKGEKEIGGRKITVTDPSVPLWFISTEGKPAYMYDIFVLIIEEYGQGEADVKRAIAEIFLNGGTPPWYLPEGSIRIAFTNKGTRYGVTKDFDFCIARRTLLKVTGDVEVWLSDFADKPYEYQGKQWQVMPVTKAWAAIHPEIMFEAEPKEQGPWCNPRTATAADRYLQVKMAMNNGVIPTDLHTIESLAGTIGMPATQSLVNHIEFRTQLPSYADVCADPRNCPVPSRPDLLMLMAYELAGWCQKDKLAECITYIQRMPTKDMAVTFVSSLLRRDYAGFINEPPMQAWINKNAALVSVIASLSH